MIDRVAKRASRNPLVRYLAYGLFCGLAGLVGGAISALVGGTGVVEVVVKAVTTTAAMAVAMFACRWWWNGLDEAAREAHKWAWWWGSTYGLAFGGVALLTVFTAAENTKAFAGWQTLDVLLSGAGLLVGVQCAGYAIAWGIWWWQRR
jgi:hypothetical protein